MKRRQFLGIACASTVFVNACKKDEPTPPTIVQGYITDFKGKPLEGLKVEYRGRSSFGSTIPVFPGGSSPDVSFSEKIITDSNGFFRVSMVVPGGIAKDGTVLSLPYSSKYIETRKNGALISRDFELAKSFDIKFGDVNEFLVIYYL